MHHGAIICLGIMLLGEIIGGKVSKFIKQKTRILRAFFRLSVVIRTEYRHQNQHYQLG